MSKAYPYSHPVPFRRKMRYDYARCQSDAFMNGWRVSRKEARDYFDQHDGASNEGGKVTLKVQEGASLNTLLERAMQDSDLCWVFIKKYEVFGCLHSHYTPQLRKHAQAVPAAALNYIVFAEILLSYAQAQDVLQYLSTLLKVMDGLCALEARSVSGQEALRIVRLIDQEAALIKEVALR